MNINSKLMAIFICFLIFGSVIFSVVNEITHPFLYIDEISEVSKNYSVDKSLVASVINVESGFNSKAKSSKGALGLMQIMPSTAIWIAEKIGLEDFSIDSLFDIKTNIVLGTWYLSYLFDKFQNVDTAICAYNAGEGIVVKWLKDKRYSFDGKNLNNCPYFETKNYIKKVKNNYKYYSKKLTKYK